MPLYDALYKKRDKIRHVRTAHEQGASHAADGYARASGKLGVCIATSGPGATNLVTGIATAFSDSSHVLFITANVDSSEIGTDSFQEADVAGITTPVCKYNWTVRDPFALEKTLRKAIKLAFEGRPGPVLIDVAHDVLCFNYPGDYSFSADDSDMSEARSPGVPEADDKLAERIAAEIKKASRPVMIAGGGVGISGAWEEVFKLSHGASIPVASTLMACGVLPSDDPLNLGMVGRYGNPRALSFVENSDLVIAVGMRFSNRTHGFEKAGKKIIHIDSDVSELGKNIETDIPVWGDAKAVLSKIIEKLEIKGSETASRKTDFCQPEKTGNCLFSESADRLVSEVFLKIKEKLGDVSVVTDVGIHQMATARLYPFEKPGRLITSGGFGTMGFGLGAVLGASVAAEEGIGVSRGTVLVTGDGSLRMSVAELASIRENGIKTLIIVLNNKSLGMVRDIQKSKFGRRYIATDASYRVPDFKAAAKAYGLSGFTVKDLQGFEKALDQYIGGRKAAVIDVRI